MPGAAESRRDRFEHASSRAAKERKTGIPGPGRVPDDDPGAYLGYPAARMFAPPSSCLKVCCIADLDEARTAVSLGAQALGLVSAMPSGPGPIPDQRIGEIADRVPPPIATFLLTCRTDAASIVAQQALCRTNVIQLVDRVEPAELRALRAELRGVKLVAVVHVCDAGAWDEACATAPLVDALLLDSGNPNLPVKELGGTGRTHDWSTSRRIRESVPVPVFLAGGLNERNVREACEVVRPYGVDLCSGVRTDGALDPAKLARFVTALRGSHAGGSGRGERI